MRHSSDKDQRLEAHCSRKYGGSLGGAISAELQIFTGEIAKLHAKIGQLVIERDFLSAAFSRILGIAACGLWRGQDSTPSLVAKAPRT